jgi:6-phosphogluconolactonase
VILRDDVVVLETVAAISEAAAREIVDAAAGALAERSRFVVALAGGETPRPLYGRLASEYRDAIAWDRTDACFGDERCVPPTDADSNYRMAREALLDRVAPANVHRMPGELGAEEAAAEYDRLLGRLGLLDLVLLGVGPDGHTASLFPGRPEVNAEGWAVAVHDAPKPPPDRVSLTLGTLQAAHRVLVLATGADKADAVAKAQRGEVPAGMIPHAEWLVDRAAAGEISARR